MFWTSNREYLNLSFVVVFVLHHINTRIIIYRCNFEQYFCCPSFCLFACPSTFLFIHFFISPRPHAMKLYTLTPYGNLQMLFFISMFECLITEKGLHVKIFLLLKSFGYMPKSISLICFHQKDLLWQGISLH